VNVSTRISNDSEVSRTKNADSRTILTIGFTIGTTISDIAPGTRITNGQTPSAGSLNSLTTPEKIPRVPLIST
jgi:hypothetical protein